MNSLNTLSSLPNNASEDFLPQSLLPLNRQPVAQSVSHASYPLTSPVNASFNNFTQKLSTCPPGFPSSFNFRMTNDASRPVAVQRNARSQLPALPVASSSLGSQAQSFSLSPPWNSMNSQYHDSSLARSSASFGFDQRQNWTPTPTSGRMNRIQEQIVLLRQRQMNKSFTPFPSRGLRSKRLHVSNIPFKMTAHDLEFMFNWVGRVTDSEIISNERGSKGYGFITFADEAAAEKAIHHLQGTIIDGRRIEVNEAHPKNRFKITPGPGMFEAPEEDKQLFVQSLKPRHSIVQFGPYSSSKVMSHQLLSLNQKMSEMATPSIEEAVGGSQLNCKTEAETVNERDKKDKKDEDDDSGNEMTPSPLTALTKFLFESNVASNK